MVAPIVLVDAGIVGFAIAGAFVSLVLGVIRRRWPTMACLAAMSLCVACFCISRILLYGSGDVDRSRAIVVHSVYYINAFLALAPFLFRAISNERPKWPDYALLGWFAVLSAANALLPHGAMWQRVISTVEVDLGWLGTVFMPTGTRSSSYLLNLVIELAAVLYCLALAAKLWHRGFAFRLAAFTLPIATIVAIILSIGQSTGTGGRPILLEFVGLTLYIVMGMVVVSVVQQDLAAQQDELVYHAKEESKLKQLLDSLPMPVAWAKDRNIEYFNPCFVETYGYSTSSTPTLDSWFGSAYPDPDHRTEVVQRWQAILEDADRNGGRISPNLFDIACLDGTVKNVLISGTLIGDSHVVVIEDVTEQQCQAMALKDSELKFRTVFQCSPMLLGIADLKDGVFLDANDAGVAASGYTIDQIRGHGAVELGWMSQEDRDRLQELIVRDGRVRGLELQFHRTDGQIIDAMLSAERVTLSGRDCIITAAMDITDRKRVEKELGESERRLTNAISATSDGIWEADLRSGKAFYSSRCYEMLGYSTDEFVFDFNLYTKLCHPDDLPSLKDRVSRMKTATADAMYRLEYRMLRKDGTWAWILGRGRVVERDSKGQPTVLAGTNIDITERKEQEQQLRYTIARLNDAQRIAKIGFWAVDKEAGTTSWSEGVKAIFGLPLESPAPNYSEYMEFVHKDDRDYVHQQDKLHLQQDGPNEFHYFYRIISKTGELKHLEHRSRVTRCEDGTVSRIDGSVLDVTERMQREKELQDTIAKVNEAQEIAKIGFWSVSMPDMTVEWSDGVRAIFELPLSAPGIALEEFLQYIHEDDRESILQQVQRHFEPLDRTDLSYVYRIRTKGGTVKYIEHHGRQKLDENGKLVSISGSVLDVTERQLAEESLKRLNRELRAISNCNQTLLRATNEQQLLDEVCRIICDEAGYLLAWVGYKDLDQGWEIKPVAHAGPQSDYLGSISVYWSDDELGSGPTGTAMRTGTTVQVNSFEREPKMGPWKQIAEEHNLRSNIALPLFDLDEKPFGVLTIYSSETDIFVESEVRLLEELAGDLAFGINSLRLKKQKEETEHLLEESNIRSSALFHNAPMLGALYKIIRDESGKMIDWEYVDVNRIAIEQDSRLDRRVIGKRAIELFGNEAIGVHIERARIVDETGEPSVSEVYLERHDKHYLTSWFKVGPDYLVSFAVDITKIKQADEKIQRINQELELRVADRTIQLEQANRELESFSYSVSHDLRSPLRHINGFAGILREHLGESIDAETEQYLQTITRASERMGNLIDGLLTFARMARCELKLVATDLNNVVSDLKHELLIGHESRPVEWIVSGLPKVRADKTLIRSVFMNLMSNALKFSRTKDKSVIEISCETTDKEHIFKVKDNGVGFNQEYADKLFGVFQRLHTADEFEGTGIGLANIRRIITRHGGRTWAESVLNEGATFYFTLPIESAQVKVRID